MKIKNKNRKSKLKTKIKNGILKSISVFAFIIFIVSACCLDSANSTPFYIGCDLSLIWLGLFAYANGYMEV